MGEEWDLIPEIDKTSSGNNKISSLFGETILLVGQAFDLPVYQRWLSISTLCGDSARAKEILKEQFL